MANLCGIIVSRRNDIVRHEIDDYLGECVLPDLHPGDVHVIRTPENRLFAWKNDEDCDCCEPGEFEHCYVYWEIEEADIDDILKNHP